MPADALLFAGISVQSSGPALGVAGAGGQHCFANGPTGVYQAKTPLWEVFESGLR